MRIQKWIKLLYTGFTVKIQNNGHFSESVDIQRSVHQGGCGSAFLYIILAECLAIQIRSNVNIQGISTETQMHTLNLFADDTNATGHANQANLDELLQEFDNFHTHSGLLINYEKTTLYRISSQQNLPELFTKKQIAWQDEGMQVLGVYITERNPLEKNYRPILDRVKGILDLWKNRDLSLFGKINVLNTLIASLFVHKMQVLPAMTRNMLERLNK